LKILFLLLILIPVFEITTFIISLRFIGFSYSIFEIFITFFLGFYFFSLSKKKFFGSENKRFTLFSVNKMLFKNKKSSFFILVGSALLILPGYISDIIGILLMIKPIQTVIIKHIITSFKTPSIKNSFYSDDNSETIEGEFYDLHNDKSNISKK